MLYGNDRKRKDTTKKKPHLREPACMLHPNIVRGIQVPQPPTTVEAASTVSITSKVESCIGQIVLGEVMPPGPLIEAGEPLVTSCVLRPLGSLCNDAQLLVGRAGALARLVGSPSDGWPVVDGRVVDQAGRLNCWSHRVGVGPGRSRRLGFLTRCG